MAQPITFSPADQALCLAVLKQVEVGKVNYELLRVELGLPSKNAAQVRWSRFNTKLKAGAGVVKEPTETAKPKTGARRGRPPSTANGKGQGKAKGRGNGANKKRKLNLSDDEEEAEMSDIKDEEEDADVEEGGDDTSLMTPFQTPTRKLPTRQVRVQSFKEESDEEEGEEGKEEEMVDMEKGMDGKGKETNDAANGGTDMAGQSDDEV
ncbi:uncharacterized protein LY89DRAFT_692508 [Mollisia scopiformis]|uniref:Myb-like DNA-binding domain-containing protein n=1 Tax=Mollisia scopiformis TaxID=149040 RepID=A0A132B2B1_MOLSC|nr:uncharacterized protein LY89DRAFT_692508 [Mollisia scopiformis]KUJ06383.1 hypothetical protein LY89DRAFT_692508 [Mollisia scopiformis]